MPRYDLCLAWNWEHDADFVRLMDAACARRGLSFLQARPDNLSEVLAGIKTNEITFWSFFDRASDTDRRFQPLTDQGRGLDIFRINPQEQSQWAEDKATMHLEFISHGLHTPHTIILPPFIEQSQIPALNLDPLGGRFTIKPARGGGGTGVIIEAASLEQILAARQEYPKDKYLLQAYIQPHLLGGREAWFRVIYCAGTVYPCWWDTRTHIYTPITAEEEALFGLGLLRRVTARIAGICRLDIFSTEITRTSDGMFIVADYVNDPIDLRLQSRAADGVPDGIVEKITERLALLVEVHRPLT